MRNEVLTFKRERILEEASVLFYERGFTATTLDDIAGRLGVTKPFIYGHFRSKAELLAAVCRPPLELTLAAATQGREEHRLLCRPPEAAHLRVDGDHSWRTSRTSRSMPGKLCSWTPPHGARSKSLRNRRNRVIVDLLRAGVTARELDVEDVPSAALALLGLISGVSQAPRNGNRAAGEDTPEHMARLALRMVGAREISRTSHPAGASQAKLNAAMRGCRSYQHFG